jgi:hypothetical protein
MTGEELDAILRQEWRDLLLKFHLFTCPASGENTAYVKGSALLIQVLATRDGVDLTYVDQSEPRLALYSIDGLLLRIRRDRLQFSSSRPPSHSFQDFTRISLAALARHLRAAGQDVLRGERGWMAEHGPSRLDAGPDIRAFLASHPTFRPVHA